jgi:hypothetical protein
MNMVIEGLLSSSRFWPFKILLLIVSFASNVRGLKIRLGLQLQNVRFKKMIFKNTVKRLAKS